MTKPDEKKSFNRRCPKHAILGEGRITLQGSQCYALYNDTMYPFEQYIIAKQMWLVLKDRFSRILAIKFNSYNKKYQNTMSQHPRKMANMIKVLSSIGHELRNGQQIHVVIRSLLQSCEHMKINMTHNEGIKIFDDITQHLELEYEWLEVTA